MAVSSVKTALWFQLHEHNGAGVPNNFPFSYHSFPLPPSHLVSISIPILKNIHVALSPHHFCLTSPTETFLWVLFIFILEGNYILPIRRTQVTKVWVFFQSMVLSYLPLQAVTFKIRLDRSHSLKEMFQQQQRIFSGFVFFFWFGVFFSF